MGKNKLRLDNECQNCGHTVEVAYCSKCGQKNTETRQSFGHLFTHFIEDFTHYDSGFWKTIKYLLFRPARLTKEYLEGHRQRYVAPVKLYIFISFITFFLMSVLLVPENTEQETDLQKTDTTIPVKVKILDDEYASVSDFEHKELLKPKDKRYNSFQHWLVKKLIIAQQKDISSNKVLRGFYSVLPKVLFIYMPFFAFWLWLFHGKKRWYFFDHGIFTLHYFSFLLLTLTLINILSLLTDMILNEDIAEIIISIILFLVTFYLFFYFFRAHSRIYGERKVISRIKSLAFS